MVVRMRANRSKTGMRRSHEAISGVRTSRCVCGELRQSHRACPHCGMYNGKVIIDIIARTKRAGRRSKSKETDLRASGKIKADTAKT